jgi:anhydro-N-acetylmuramic acid kinase
VCALHSQLGEWFAAAVLRTCESTGIAPGDVDLIGSHGQTVWHDPPRDAQRGATLQLGDPATLAERTGISVVSDFRARDVAAGGQGAPLVPWTDQLLFSHPERRRVLQNLGGMANVTLLFEQPLRRPPVAFDTGPGVALMDTAAEIATGGRQRCDEDGRLAAAGTVDEALLDRLMAHEYFQRPPPKSTGREAFGVPLVESLTQDLEPGRPEEGWPDLLATLTALTARSIGDSYRAWVSPEGVDDVYLLGGGARNPTLVAAVSDELSPLTLSPCEELGVDPDAREAVSFAVLAWAHARGLPANVPSVTGAAGGRILGSHTPAGA